MSIETQEQSRLEMVVENLIETMTGIDGVQGATAEEVPEAGPGDYRRLLLPHVWVMELPGEVVSYENHRLRCRIVFGLVLIFKGEVGQIRARGRRYLAAMQRALAADPCRGWDADHLSRAQDTRELSSTLSELDEPGFGGVRLDIEVTYLRGVSSPFVREDNVRSAA